MLTLKKKLPDLTNIKKERWIIPTVLFAFSAFLWAALVWVDPQPLILGLLKSGRTEILYMSPTEFMATMLTAWKIVVWISLAVSILTALVAWLHPRALVATSVFAFGAIFYAISAAPAITQQSSAPHYVYLAEAFLSFKKNRSAHSDDAMIIFNSFWHTQPESLKDGTEPILDIVEGIPSVRVFKLKESTNLSVR